LITQNKPALKQPSTPLYGLFHFSRLVRWPNLLIIVLTQYICRIFLIGDSSQWQSYLSDTALFAIGTSTLLVAAAGYIINDYFDVKIDLINKPNRVIIGRYLPRRWAITIHQIFSILGCIIGLWVSKWVFLVNVLCVSLLWIYSSYFKKKPLIGNLLVALLSAASLLILTAYYPQNKSLVWLYAGFSFGITLIRELIKDIEDMPGDVSHGCQTLPIVWGVRRSKSLIYVFLLLFTGAMLQSVFLLNNQTLYFIFGFIVLLMAILAQRLFRADTQRQYAALSQFCKIIMLIGILSMIAVKP
jgi:4-hydroxybenzoate polyprenyltransferase